MTVSVVIPSYNRPAETLRAIRSVLSQTIPAADIVVVDDASEPALDADALTSLDQRVRVVRLQRNGGAATARQFGIERASAEIVAFLDSDDWWEPTKLERQLPYFDVDSSRLLAVSCGWREVDEVGEILRTRAPRATSDASDFVSGCWFCPGSTVLVPRIAFETIGPLDWRLRRLEDFDWFARFGAAGGRLQVAPFVAATIAIGKRGRAANVEPAAQKILAKAKSSGLYSNEQLKRLRAWLAVELSRAALNDGRVGKCTLHFARSLALVPRLRVQLQDWWSEENSRVI